MLAYLLAWIIGLGSLGIYLAAFFFPEVHRKNDFIWSGIGFFYALVLWVYAERLRGGLLLGQTASVALLVWFGWQTLKLRRELTPSEQQTALPDTTAVQAKVNGVTSNLQKRLANLPIRRTSPQQPNATAAPPKLDQAPGFKAPGPVKQGETAELSSPLAADAAVAPSVDQVNSEPAIAAPESTTSKATPSITPTAKASSPKAASSATKPVKPQPSATSLLTRIKNQVQGIFRRGVDKPPASTQQSMKPKPSIKSSTTAGVEPAPTQDKPQALAGEVSTAMSSDSTGLGAEDFISVEPIAPEVELAPPAEPPSQWDIETSVETGSALIVEGSEGTPDATSLTTKAHPPKLVRPDQPDPSLIEAAQQAAEAKPEPSEGPLDSTSAPE